MAETKLLGAWGEATAAEYLRKKRYKILASGYHSRFGEIDLIASQGKYIVFVEVKLRKSDAFAAARDYVDYRKQERVKTAAAAYMTSHELDVPARFDVAEVYTDESGRIVRLEYLENAFT